MQSSTFLPMPRECRRASSRPIPASRSSRRSRATTHASTASGSQQVVGDRRRARSHVSGRRSGCTGRMPTLRQLGRNGRGRRRRASPRSRKLARRRARFTARRRARAARPRTILARHLRRRQLDVDRVPRGARRLRADLDQPRPEHRARRRRPRRPMPEEVVEARRGGAAQKSYPIVEIKTSNQFMQVAARPAEPDHLPAVRAARDERDHLALRHRQLARALDLRAHARDRDAARDRR